MHHLFCSCQIYIGYTLAMPHKSKRKSQLEEKISAKQPRVVSGGHTSFALSHDPVTALAKSGMGK